MNAEAQRVESAVQEGRPPRTSSPRPEISVLIPAYNHERYIEAAIGSVLRQTRGDFELIIIDDGSTDSTWERIQSFDDARIRALTQPNSDAYNTLNRAISMARGSFIAVLNSDDVFEPDRLEKLHAFVTEQQLECAFTNVRPIDSCGALINNPRHYWNRWHEANRAFYFEDRDLLRAFLHANLLVTTSNLFIRAEAAHTIGPFASIRYLHDYEYMLRVIRRFGPQVGYLDEPLLQYRLHGRNTLKQGAVEARLQDIQLIRSNILISVPEASRSQVEAGLDRLLVLQSELREVRNDLKHPLRRLARILLAEIKARLTPSPTP